MQYRKNYIKTPFLLIGISVLFQLVLIAESLISIWLLQKKYSNKYMIAWSIIFTPRVKFYLAFTIVVFASLLICYFIRRRYINVVLCKVYVWLVFAALVLLPIYDIVLSFFVEKEFQAHSFQIGNILFYDYPFLFSFLLLIMAFIFFIVTILKSSTLSKIKKPKNESTGFLDDFAQ